MEPNDAPPKTTPLHALHVELGARMTAFGGYDMPIQFKDGILSEHLWTRSHCGLFDVSHMGPSFLSQTNASSAAHARIAAIIERLTPSDIAGLAPGKIQLSVLLNDAGGILDDLMIGRPASESRHGQLYIVVNAGTKDADFALIQSAAGGEATLQRADDRALLAVQGPEAEAVLEAIIPGVQKLTFMTFAEIATPAFGEVLVARCGYTGEDGFEVLVESGSAVDFARALLTDPRVKPIGLGARDSLRLEAGMCLYGHDIDANVSPIGASLGWMVSKVRRERGDFPGAARILDELKLGPPMKRVGIKPLGRTPAREGAEVQSVDGARIGVVTSGGFGPTLNAPIAMGYVATTHAKIGAPLKLIVRGKALDAEVAALPFTPHRYKR